MNRYISAVFFLQLVSACEIVNEPETSESSLLEELDRALNAELTMPEGGLRNIVVYGGNPEQVSSG